MVIFPIYDSGILDLSSIPIVDLQKLSKCVSDGVRINMNTCDGDLSPVIANINCNWVQLSLHHHLKGKSSLTTAETQALVTAMVSVRGQNGQDGQDRAGHGGAGPV